ncbi:MAG: efflux RND transporter periplasmic adaptor subunit [Clostridia bacterium]|nr:efflux RND transporter periplasmic adaptor subunit [Clostridia bacterium]
MKSIAKGILVLGMFVLLVITNAGCSGSAETVTQDASKSTPSEKKTENQTVDAFGVIKANKSKNISISFPTVVENVEVKDGQRVRKGDILLTLNTTELQEQIHVKEAELELEKRLLAKKQANPDMSKLQNDLRNAQNLYEKDLKELSNKETLFKSGSISRYDLDEFIKVADAKKKIVEDLQYAIRSSSLNTGSDKDSSNTKISTLTSEIKIMKEKLNRSYLKENKIVCDLDNGLITNLKPSSGYVVKEPEILLDIIDLNSLVALADVDEGFIKAVKPGAKVTVIPLADRSKSFEGSVLRITDKAILKNGQTFIQVEIGVKDREGFLQLDYNVDVKIAKE